MKKHVILLVTFLLVVVTSSIALAQKIEVDPNTPEAVNENAAEQAVTTKDDRLLQKITYTAADKRLHSIIEDLSRMSGVTIRSGKNDNDWQVRDLPVVVCVRDMPLGTLLRTIADCAHLEFTSTLIGDIQTYRIWRGSKNERLMSNYFEQMHKYGVENCSREWDLYAKIGTISDADFAKAAAECRAQYKESVIDDSRQFECLQLMAKFIALTEPGTKQKVFAGERLTFAYEDLPPAQARMLETIIRHKCEINRENTKVYVDGQLLPAPETPITDEHLNDAKITVRFSDGDTPGLVTKLESPCGGGSPVAWMTPGILRKFVKDAPAFPKHPDYPETDYSPNLKKISFYPLDDLSILQEKYKIETPEGVDDMSTAQLLVTLAEKADIDIVAEDFKMFANEGDLYKHTLNQDFPLHKILQAAAGSRIWRIDQQSRVLVGSYNFWCEAHKQLIPESYMIYFQEKMNGDGVELDDLVMLLRLTKMQCSSWTWSMPDELRNLPSFSGSEPMWKFYDSLSPEDKALAKSESGLPLAKFDRAYMMDLMRSVVASLPDVFFSYKVDTAKYDCLLDEKLLPELVMRIESQECDAYKNVLRLQADSNNLREESVRVKKNKYSMRIEWPEVSLHFPGFDSFFPICSVKRETELWKVRQQPAVQY